MFWTFSLFPLGDSNVVSTNIKLHLYLPGNIQDLPHISIVIRFKFPERIFQYSTRNDKKNKFEPFSLSVYISPFLSLSLFSYLSIYFSQTSLLHRCLHLFFLPLFGSKHKRIRMHVAREIAVVEEHFFSLYSRKMFFFDRKISRVPS